MKTVKNNWFFVSLIVLFLSISVYGVKDSFFNNAEARMNNTVSTKTENGLAKYTGFGIENMMQEIVESSNQTVNQPTVNK